MWEVQSIWPLWLQEIRKCWSPVLGTEDGESIWVNTVCHYCCNVTIQHEWKENQWIIIPLYWSPWFTWVKVLHVTSDVSVLLIIGHCCSTRVSLPYAREPFCSLCALPNALNSIVFPSSSWLLKHCYHSRTQCQLSLHSARATRLSQTAWPLDPWKRHHLKSVLEAALFIGMEVNIKLHKFTMYNEGRHFRHRKNHHASVW